MEMESKSQSYRKRRHLSLNQTIKNATSVRKILRMIRNLRVALVVIRELFILNVILMINLVVIALNAKDVKTNQSTPYTPTKMMK